MKRKRPRFVVVEVNGNLTSRNGGSKRPGLSATVLDRTFNHAEMMTFRSEDRVAYNRNRGVDGARAAACELADRLNLKHRGGP